VGPEKEEGFSEPLKGLQNQLRPGISQEYLVIISSR
jgi:hypothetical protein